MEKALRVSGVHVEVEVSTLVRDIGAMIDAARKQVSVAANDRGDIDAVGDVSDVLRSSDRIQR